MHPGASGGLGSLHGTMPVPSESPAERLSANQPIRACPWLGTLDELRTLDHHRKTYDGALKDAQICDSVILAERDMRLDLPMHDTAQTHD